MFFLSPCDVYGEVNFWDDEISENSTAFLLVAPLVIKSPIDNNPRSKWWNFYPSNIVCIHRVLQGCIIITKAKAHFRFCWLRQTPETQTKTCNLVRCYIYIYRYMYKPTGLICYVFRFIYFITHIPFICVFIVWNARDALQMYAAFIISWYYC